MTRIPFLWNTQTATELLECVNSWIQSVKSCLHGTKRKDVNLPLKNMLLSRESVSTLTLALCFKTLEMRVRVYGIRPRVRDDHPVNTATNSVAHCGAIHSLSYVRPSSCSCSLNPSSKNKLMHPRRQRVRRHPVKEPNENSRAVVLLSLCVCSSRCMQCLHLHR